MKQIRNFIIVLLALTIGVYAVSSFPEGDAPSAQDSQTRSLQKINNLLYAGGGASASAPVLAATTVVDWSSYTATLTTNSQTFATIVGVTGSTRVRKLSIQADSSNTADVLLGPDDAFHGDPYAPRHLGPGQEYVIEGPAGSSFTLDNWVVASASGSQLVSFFYGQ